MNKYLLPALKDRQGVMYIDQAEICQKDFTIIAKCRKGDYDIPVATLICLMFGLGISITHNAIKQIADYGCSIVWVGNQINYYYTYGVSLASASDNLLKQCKYHESKILKNEVIHKLYSLRYPDVKLKTKTLDELQGIEGMKMQQAYRFLSQKYQIAWIGRQKYPIKYERQDPINRAITSANQVLYAIITSSLNALGYSPTISFIHNGDMFSFVYDIADLYKEKYILPLVFEYISLHNEYEDRLLKAHVNNTLMKQNFILLIINHLDYLFSEK